MFDLCSSYTLEMLIRREFTTVNNTVLKSRHKHKGSQNPTQWHFLNSTNHPATPTFQNKLRSIYWQQIRCFLRQYTKHKGPTPKTWNASRETCKWPSSPQYFNILPDLCPMHDRQTFPRCDMGTVFWIKSMPNAHLKWRSLKVKWVSTIPVVFTRVLRISSWVGM